MCPARRSYVEDVTPQPVWHGTRDEAIELTSVIAGNCSCEFEPKSGARVSTCAAHAMIEDQRLLDRLAFARYIARRLVQQEFGLAPSTAGPGQEPTT